MTDSAEVPAPDETGSPRARRPLTGAALWLLRVAWLMVAIAGGGAFGDALADARRAVQLVGTGGAWIVWTLVALVLMVPSTASLTLARMFVPGAAVAAVVAAFSGAGFGSSVAAIALTALCTALVASGDVGRAFVQGSAYGDERRFPLRPPVSVVVPITVTWSVWCAATIVGPLLLAAADSASGTIAGGLVTAAAGGLGVLFGLRAHRLATRWLVVVPAGVVIHDPVVLGETLMVRAAAVRRAALAFADTEALDLTGPAAGHAIELEFVDTTTVLRAPRRDTPTGTAFHARAVLVAPTRPGAALRAIGARRIPVG